MPDADSSAQAAEGRINSYALVSYIPGPLGQFLNELRRQLEPGSLEPRAHVTILPPRPLAEGIAGSDAAGQLRRTLEREWAPIEIELGQVEVFAESDVVYVAVARGGAPLCGLHRRLNEGALDFREPYPYHPHVTLAQGMAAGEAEKVRREASRLWQAYDGRRSFPVDVLYFVQNTLENGWVDLERFACAADETASPAMRR